MDEEKNHIETLTPDLIDKYLQGTLSESEQYAVEKLMLNSEFDADGLEGLSQEVKLKDNLILLNSRLDARIAAEKKSSITFWLKIAASVIILAASTYLILRPSFKISDEKNISALKSDEPEKAIEEIEIIEEKAIEQPAVKSNDFLAMNEPKKEKLPAVTQPKVKTNQPEQSALMDDETAAPDDILSEQVEEDMLIAEVAAENVPALEKAEEAEAKETVTARIARSKKSIPSRSAVGTNADQTLGAGVSEGSKTIALESQAYPIGGMEAFEQYLKDSVRYADNMEIKDEVIVTFDIEADGALTNFEIKRSLGEPFDNEALRLIKEGPKWIPAKNNGEAIKSSARVIVNFEQ